MSAITQAPRAVDERTVGAAARFTGIWPLIRLAVRRDRVLVPTWLAVVVMSVAGSVSATIGLYPTVASRVQIAQTINSNPTFAALYGPVLDPESMGQVAMFKMYAFGAALIGLLAIFVLARHTRGEEESGRTELVGAGVVGRWAPLGAALVWTVVVVVAIGLLTAVGLVVAGLDVVGSLSFGLAWTVTGLAFTGIAAVAAQVTTTSRGTKGLAGAVLGGSYLVRAIADGSPDGELVGLRWLSPVGWAQEVSAFSDPRWAVGVLGVGFAGLMAVVAFALVERRDLGAGLFSDRAGRADGPRSLSSGLGLAWRLHRGMLTGWLLGSALMSMVLGGLIANIGGFVDEGMAALLEKLGGQQAIEDTFMAAEFSFLGLFFGGYAIAAVLRLRTEESAGRVEVLLATGLTRTRLAGAHLVAALGGVVALLITVAVFVGFSAARSTGDVDWWGKVAGAAAVQLPAIAVMVGLAMLAIGLVPRLASAVSWGMFVAFFLLGEIGSVLGFSQWVLDLSPFSHTPRLPGAEVDAGALVALSVLAVALIGAGLVAYRRRDLV